MSGAQAPPWWLAGLHLLVLWSFAVAQPLFDLLGRNGEFFAARGSTRWDAIVFALVLLFVPPRAPARAGGSSAEPCAGPFTPFFVAGLAGLFVLQAIRGSGAPGWLLVAFAVALGAGAAVLYLRAPAARLALTVLAPAPLLFLGLFLFHSDVSRLSLKTEAAQAAGEHPRAPVVLIAFDELPVNSLLNAHGRIDAVRFPNFARLARGSSWFEHTTTVAEGTTHAVPGDPHRPLSRRPASSRSTPTTARTCSRSSAAGRSSTSSTRRRTSAHRRCARGSRARSATARPRSPRTPASSTSTSCCPTT